MILRSALFAPANHERHATKALIGPADAAILDLEDAVAVDQKVHARQAAVELLRHRPRGGPSAFVRVNALNRPFGYDDLRAVAASSPDGIVLPKCEFAQDVVAADRL